MGKRRILSELDKLEQKILADKEMVFFQDIIIALGIDVKNLVAKADATKAALIKSIMEKKDETRPT